jgi:hypothetical protein
MTKPRDPNCCLCGLPYERIGNNPAPLITSAARCCDACDEVVIEARIHPATILAEQDRVAEALAYWLEIGSFELPVTATRHMALAAICASRGPGLLAEKQRQFAKLREINEQIAADDAKL